MKSVKSILKNFTPQLINQKKRNDNAQKILNSTK